MSLLFYRVQNIQLTYTLWFVKLGIRFHKRFNKRLHVRYALNEHWLMFRPSWINEKPWECTIQLCIERKKHLSTRISFESCKHSVLNLRFVIITVNILNAQFQLAWRVFVQHMHSNIHFADWFSLLFVECHYRCSVVDKYFIRMNQVTNSKSILLMPTN